MPTTAMEACLAEVHRQLLDYLEGEVADYIPELAKVDPDWFGISLATRDGHVYEVGDADRPSRSSRSPSRSPTASRSRTTARTRCWRRSASSPPATRSMPSA